MPKKSSPYFPILMPADLAASHTNTLGGEETRAYKRARKSRPKGKNALASSLSNTELGLKKLGPDVLLAK
jgi:hypothetical protein